MFDASHAIVMMESQNMGMFTVEYLPVCVKRSI